MKQSLLILSLCLAATGIRAQSLSPQVIASSGAYATSGTISLSYTVGEMSAVQTLTGSSVILTQGFQQPSDIVNGLLDIEPAADGAFILYPNPAVARVWYGYAYEQRGQVEVSLYDVTGRRLDYALAESYETGKVVHNFDCASYAAGEYVLTARFTAQGGQVKTLSKKFQILN